MKGRGAAKMRGREKRMGNGRGSEDKREGGSEGWSDIRGMEKRASGGSEDEREGWRRERGNEDRGRERAKVRGEKEETKTRLFLCYAHNQVLEL